MTGPARLGRSCLALVTGAMGLAGCRGSAGSAAPLPAPSTILTVALSEYSIRPSGPLPAGRVVFRFVNSGRENHAPMLVALEDGSPKVDELVRTASPGPALANVNPREPGQTGAFAADLQRGKRYALVCRYSAPDGTPHAQKGMTWESRAGDNAGRETP